MRLRHVTPCLVALLFASVAQAQGGGPGGGPPPAQVVLGEATPGRLVPTADFEGTVYYKEVSAVATELAGKVVQVNFDVGDRVSRGTPLVSLDTEISQARLRSARALVAQRQAQLQQEQARYERAVLLVADEVTTEQEFDDIRFTRDAVGQQLEAARAEVALLELEISKKEIRAPFDGVVMQRHAEVGEWLGAGAPLATLAREDLYDVIVFVPERFLPFVELGRTVEMRVLGNDLTASIVPSSPDGDIATRTFPVRLRLTEPSWLRSGMAAIARMPTGFEQEAVLVPRDAVLLEGGLEFIVLASDETALRREVSVLGYEGGMAGLAPGAIEPGTQVIVKGHERLRSGQPIRVAGP